MLCQLSRDLTLSDAVRTSDEDRGVSREDPPHREKSANRHAVEFGHCLVAFLSSLLYHRDQVFALSVILFSISPDWQRSKESDPPDDQRDEAEEADDECTV